MSWDAAIFGTLHVPPAQFKSFLARSAEASAVPNVEKYLSLFEVTGDPVKKVLATLGRFKAKEGLAFVELTTDAAGGRVAVRAFGSKDEFLRHSVMFAAVWAAAGEGASGELYFAGMLTAGFGYKLTVGGDGVHLEELPRNEMRAQPEYAAVQARVEARVAEIELTRNTRSTRSTRKK